MLKNEKLVHRLTTKEKLSLIISNHLFRSGEVEGYSFPSFELKNDPFDGSRHIKATNYPTQKALAMTWNKGLINRTAYFLGTENSIFTSNPIFNVTCKLDRNYISDDPYILATFSNYFIEGLERSQSFTCIESGKMSDDIIVNKEMLDLPLDTIVKSDKEDFILVSSLDEMYSLQEDFATTKTFFGQASSAVEVARYINEGLYLVFFEGDKEEMLAKLEILAENGVRLEGQLKNGAIDKIEYNRAFNMGEAIKPNVLATACDNYIELLLTIEKKRKKSISESKFISATNQLPFDYNKHNDRALEAAKEGIVLLKNEESILPLSSELKVAIVGDAFSNNSYYRDLFTHESSLFSAPVDKIQDYLEINYLGYAHGYLKGQREPGLLESMETLVNDADVSIFFMAPDPETGGIPENQIEALVTLYVKTEKPIILVIIGDKYVDLSFADKCKAIIYCPNLGQNISQVVLDTITGAVNPSGRLVSDYPVVKKEVEGEEKKQSEYPGYTDLTAQRLYPMGYGLSYSTFEYKNLSISDSGVSFTVTNSSDRDGYDVPQIYIYKSGESSLSHRLLKGFEKVFIKAHQTERVTIEFDENTFRYYNTKKNCYGVEGGEYVISICSNSDTVRLEGTLHLSKFLDRTYLYDSTTLTEKIQTKHDFETADEQIKNMRCGVKLLVSSLISLYLIGMFAFFWWMLVFKNTGSYENIGTIVFLVLVLVTIIVYIVYNSKNFKKKKELVEDYNASNRTLFEMIDTVKDFEVEKDIIYDLKSLEDEAEETIDDLVKENEEAKPEYQETDLEVEKEVQEEQIEDISAMILTQEDIDAHEQEQLDKLESEYGSRDEEFDEYEDTIEFTTDSSISRVVNKFVDFAESKDLIVEMSSARSLFSAIASSKIIVLDSKIRELLPEFIQILQEYIGSKSHVVEAKDEWISPFDLSWFKNELGQYVKTDFINDLYNACRFKNNLNALFLTNVSVQNCDRYLKDFIDFSSNPNETHTLKLNKSQAIKIPTNVTLFIVPKEENYIDVICDSLAANACCLDLILRKTDMESYSEVKPEIISSSYLEDLVYESKKINYIPEELWKKVDALEGEIKSQEKWRIENKTVLAIERYASIYIEAGGDKLDCLDAVLSEKIIPLLKKLKMFSGETGKQQLLEMFERHFGEDNIPKSRRVINTNVSE